MMTARCQTIDTELTEPPGQHSRFYPTVPWVVYIKLTLGLPQICLMSVSLGFIIKEPYYQTLPTAWSQPQASGSLAKNFCSTLNTWGQTAQELSSM